ncbi:hypothetical protein MKW92_010786, partial [Papaver armeniacum]
MYRISVRLISTSTTPAPSPSPELPSAKSKTRMNVEKSDENNMSLIFLMACFYRFQVWFLIGYMTGII